MNTLPLIFIDGHLFLQIDGNLWLFDTGAPTSFGNARHITIAGKRFELSGSYMGLSTATLSQFVGVECLGLIGADILSCFDHIIDCIKGTLSISKAELAHNGQMLCLSEFMGIPIVKVQIRGADYPMFFDTGAQISYFQDDSLADFPAAGNVTDFYPGIGQFDADTHEVEVGLGLVTFILRCSKLPGLLEEALMLADAGGIIGNQVLADRITGYFPQRKALCL